MAKASRLTSNMTQYLASLKKIQVKLKEKETKPTHISTYAEIT